MGIEAELKARVRDLDRVRGLLHQRATQQNSVYYDVYFDTPDRTLTRSGRELRVREAHTDADVDPALETIREVINALGINRNHPEVPDQHAIPLGDA